MYACMYVVFLNPGCMRGTSNCNTYVYIHVHTHVHVHVRCSSDQSHTHTVVLGRHDVILTVTIRDTVVSRATSEHPIPSSDLHIHTLCHTPSSFPSPSPPHIICNHKNIYTDTYTHVYTYVHMHTYMYICIENHVLAKRQKEHTSRKTERTCIEN